MKIALTVLSAVLSSGALALDNLPELSGVAIVGLFQTQALSFTPGKFTKCVERTADKLIIQNCDLDGAATTIRSAAGETRTFAWKKVLMMSTTEIPTVEYTYSGEWTERVGEVEISTPVYLDLRYTPKRPRVVSGEIRMQRYNLHFGVEANFPKAYELP